MHGVSDEVLLVQVRVGQGLGEGEVVRSVESVAGVKIEHNILPCHSLELGQLGL